jgi:hypothetical protein
VRRVAAWGMAIRKNDYLSARGGGQIRGVAFDGRNQADVREAEFSPVALPGNLKDNVSACPLSLVFDEGNLAVQDMPYDFRAWNQCSDLLRAAVKVSGAEEKLSAECD